MRLASIHEGTALALDQLRANKSRSALTILGVVVGVAVVMAMSAMVSGIRTSIVDAVMQGGPQNFLVMRFDPNAPRDPNRHGPPWGHNPQISMEEVRRVGQLPSVKAAIGDVNASGEISYMGQRISDLNVAGQGDKYVTVSGGEIVKGHSFLASDVEAARPVAVLVPQLAQDLFGTLDPVGRRVRINGQAFDVIGIYKLPESIFSGAQKHVVFVPFTAAIKYLKAQQEFMDIYVRPADNVPPADAMDQVTIALRTLRGLRPGQPDNFAIVKMEEFVKLFDRLTGAFFIVMLVLSSVGLMVGGVGVIAIMMIAVTERTREIGIRKALGATQREILLQFLIEAVTVTLIGAAVGMAIGGAGAFIVAALTPIPAYVPAWAVAAALLLAAVAGVAFGLWPAWRAARMDPVEALRYE